MRDVDLMWQRFKKLDSRLKAAEQILGKEQQRTKDLRAKVKLLQTKIGVAQRTAVDALQKANKANFAKFKR